MQTSHPTFKQSNSWALGLALVLLSIFYLSGLPGVPFHPDETTYIFMSADGETLFTNPRELFWLPVPLDEVRQRYRELDPPTSRSLIAIGRVLTGQPSLPADWDWSATWQVNQKAGALPSSDLLTVSRASVALFFPFSLLFLYLAARQISGKLFAWIAMLLMAANALVLLHTRRAMSESFLLFTITLSLYFMVRFRQRPWLAAIPVALAINAKLSAAPLAGVGGLVILLTAFQNKWGWKKLLCQSVLYGITIFVLTFLLNPFLWATPAAAARSAWHNRLLLTERQVATVADVSPEMVLDSFPKRIGNLVAHLFYTPPAIADVANYVEQTRNTGEHYLNNPLHSLGRGPAVGSLLLILTATGFILALLDLWRTKSTALLILFLAGLSQISAIFLLVPLPFQRYVLPVVPFACLWASYSISKFLGGAFTAINKKRGSAMFIPEPPSQS